MLIGENLIIDCDECGQTHTKGYHASKNYQTVKRIKSLYRAPTPAKGEPMPKTIEYYIKRGDMDQELIMEQKEEISRLKQTVNKLRQKRDSQSVKDVSML
jgi:hypothetical protein